MSHSKILPVVFIVASLVGGSTMIASAQEAPASTATETAAPASNPGMLARIKAKFGGDRGFGRGGEMFQKIMVEVDADKNGSVTEDEINTFRAAKVAAADTSKDGVLSLDEFATAYNELMRSRMVDAFQNLDDDGNGSITAAELDSRFGSVVAKMDRNGDGALSPADRPERGGKGKHRGNDNN